jgi:hypothetical protein
MGQYWQLINRDRKEAIGTHEFGTGLKFTEQFFKSGFLYQALMVLVTDTSSLGTGGGDFMIEDVPKELKKLIDPVIGCWSGDRVVLSGDYTKIKEHQQTDDDGNLLYKDISEQVALAVWAMVADEIMKSTPVPVEAGIESARIVKNKLLEFLEKEVCGYKIIWERDRSVQRLLEAIDSICGDIVESGEASETNHDGDLTLTLTPNGDSSVQPRSKRAHKQTTFYNPIVDGRSDVSRRGNGGIKKKQGIKKKKQGRTVKARRGN